MAGSEFHLARREFLAAVAAAGLLTACGRDTAAVPATPTSGPWRFTDDRGMMISLDARPERIVTNETAGSAMARLGVKPVGIFAGSALPESPSLANLDLTGIEPVGVEYGVVNLEKLAALQPDLIVTAFDPRQGGPVFGFTDAGVQDKAQSLAPIGAFDGIRDPLVVIKRFEELAAVLGADPRAPRVAADRARFERVSDELRAALATKPGLLAVALTVDGEQVLFARPATFPGLRQLRQLGLNLVAPEGGGSDPRQDFVGFFWKPVSFEQAGSFPADLILYARGDPAAQPDALTQIPTLQASAAAQAGQFAPWRKLEDWSYQTYAADIEALLGAVRNANPDLVG